MYKVDPHPFEQSCDPDTDVTKLLPPDQASYYNSIIDVMCQME